MTMVFRRRNIPSTKCPSCRSDNLGNPEAQVTWQDSCICNLTYCRIEEVQEITVREEDHVPQSKTTTLALTAPLTRPRPQITVSDDDDFTHYSRIQVIDTSFQLQRAGEDRNLAGLETLSVLDLNDLERLAAYLARLHGLPEEDCLVALRECELQVQTIRGEHDSDSRQEGYASPRRCHSCHRTVTPTWRRGPDGDETLCNACGLHYAKLTRKMAARKAASWAWGVRG